MEDISKHEVPIFNFSYDVDEQDAEALLENEELKVYKQAHVPSIRRRTKMMRAYVCVYPRPCYHLLWLVPRQVRSSPENRRQNVVVPIHGALWKVRRIVPASCTIWDMIN